MSAFYRVEAGDGMNAKYTIKLLYWGTAQKLPSVGACSPVAS
jgi:hypothetical protein